MNRPFFPRLTPRFYLMRLRARVILFGVQCRPYGVPMKIPISSNPLVGRGSEARGAVVNDSPGDCQSRDLTEPAGETLLPPHL